MYVSVDAGYGDPEVGDGEEHLFGQGEGEGFGDGLVGYVVVPERGVLDCA